MKKIVVIPTYNESDNIIELISAIHHSISDMDILIVDDSSPDGTADLVRNAMQNDDRVHLIVRPGKMGLGTAYCEGFQYALDRGYEAICEMDADFSHNPEDLPRLIKELDNYDLILGSRYVSGVNVVNWPLRRLFLSYGANLYSRIVTRMNIKDATGGFKCFRASSLSKINLKKIKTNGYGFQIEMNFHLWKTGARIKEIPIIFIDRRSGVSKMNKKIIYEAVFLVWKLLLIGSKHVIKK